MSVLVRITNGVDTISVLPGAFKSIYKGLGYYIVEGQKPQENSKPQKQQEEHDEFEELLEKPITQWSKNEIKQFAKEKGIDISGASNATEAKEIIKAYLEENEQ